MLGLFRDDAATETDVAGIKDGGLARSGAFDRLGEAENDSRASGSLNCAVDKRGTVAEADLETARVLSGVASG